MKQTGKSLCNLHNILSNKKKKFDIAQSDYDIVAN